MSELSDLFDKDPLSLTKEDRAMIIAEYRNKREQFVLGIKVAKAKAPKKPAGPISLEDLGL